MKTIKKQKLIDYLNKTSKHVFLTEKEELVFVRPTKDGWTVFRSGRILNYTDKSLQQLLDNNKASAPRCLEDDIFLPWNKHRAIKQTKAVREMIKTKLEENDIKLAA